MKLPSTHRALLSTALQRDDGTPERPANLNGGAFQKVIGKLLRTALLWKSERLPLRGTRNRFRAPALTVYPRSWIARKFMRPAADEGSLRCSARNGHSRNPL
jgi:hypothetical protein